MKNNQMMVSGTESALEQRLNACLHPFILHNQFGYGAEQACGVVHHFYAEI
ncbi:hypothetical protein [Bacillus swezeyi]|uniref:hypothetical protein n=1 Tax=Bacillus swezeyi TaxID=1925020 RepID=UPI001653D409|nr:hypothetical protein [Bacillus swezeyi]